MDTVTPQHRFPFRSASGSGYRRAATLPLWLLLIGGLLFVLSLADARWREGPSLASSQTLVTALDLTDLALFTEARYTRHPSQADRHSAAQDHPLALEHFPSGSLLPPPARLHQP